MPKRKTPEEKPEDQFKRFVKAAKEREVNPREAEAVFEKLTDPKDKSLPTPPPSGPKP